MINIYSVYDFQGAFIGIYKTDKTLEEKKEELINSLLLDRKPLSLIESLDTKRNYSFDLKLIKTVSIEESISEYERIKKDYDELRVNEVIGEISAKTINYKRLQFNDNWVTFSRPTLLSNRFNPIIKEIFPVVELQIEDAVDIIKEYSSFIIHNMEKKLCTRIPFIGAFKIKKSLAVKELNDEKYGTSNYRRRKEFRDRQDLDKMQSDIQQDSREEKEE